MLSIVSVLVYALIIHIRLFAFRFWKTQFEVPHQFHVFDISILVSVYCLSQKQMIIPFSLHMICIKKLHGQMLGNILLFPFHILQWYITGNYSSTGEVLKFKPCDSMGNNNQMLILTIPEKPHNSKNQLFVYYQFVVSNQNLATVIRHTWEKLQNKCDTQ